MTVLAGTCGAARPEAAEAWLRRVLTADGASTDALRFVAEPSLGLSFGYRERVSGAAGAEYAHSERGGVGALVLGEVRGRATDAASLATAFEAEGEAVLGDLIGAFAAVLVDLRSRRLLLVRGAGGQRSLFHATVDDGIAFASDAAALALHPSTGSGWEPRAVLDHLSYGVVWGTRTLHPGVRLLLPGTLCAWSGEGAPSIRPHGAFPDGGELPDLASAVEAIDAALHASMQRSAAGEQPAALCLSAGLDSRVLLAVAYDAGVVPECVTNGIEGGIELRLTARMCAAVGAPQRLCLIGDDLVEGMLEASTTVAGCTDGEGDVKNAMMLYVGRRYRDELGLRRVVRGHGGELMKLSTAYGFAMPEALATSRDHARGLEHLAERLCAGADPARVASVLAESLAEQLRAAPAASLAESYDALTNDARAVGQCASLLFLTQYNGRNTVNAMRCIRESVEVTQPFLDEDVVRAILRAPVAARIDAELQTRVIARNSRALIEVPNSELRVPLDAGPVRRRVVGLVQRLARRMGMGAVDVPEKWLVARLGELFRTVLDDPRSLERSWIDPDALRALVGAGRAGDAVLLGRLSMLELTARRFEDEMHA